MLGMSADLQLEHQVDVTEDEDVNSGHRYTPDVKLLAYELAADHNLATHDLVTCVECGQPVKDAAPCDMLDGEYAFCRECSPFDAWASQDRSAE